MYINHSRKNQWPRRPGGIDRFGGLPLNGARLMMRTPSRRDRHFPAAYRNYVATRGQQTKMLSRPDRDCPAAYRNRWFGRLDEHEQAARPILITDYGPSR